MEEIKQYLNKLIELETENKEKRDELNNLKQTFEEVINNFNNKKLTSIGEEQLQTVLTTTYPKEEALNKLKKFNDAKVFESFLDNDEIPQIKEIKTFLEKLKNVLADYTSSIDEKLVFLEQKIQNSDTCHYYLKLFEEPNFINKFTPTEFEKFIKFLSDNSENKDDAIKIITDFSKEMIKQRLKQPLTEEFIEEPQELIVSEEKEDEVQNNDKDTVVPEEIENNVIEEILPSVEIETINNNEETLPSVETTELEQIKQLIKELNEQLLHVELTEAEQKQVDSYMGLIKDYGQIDRTMIEYLEEPVLLTVVLNTLVNEYDYYLELEKTKDEYLSSGMQKEFITEMNKTLNKIRILLDMKKSEKEMASKEERNSLVVFLPNKDGYFAYDDKEVLTKDTEKHLNNSISYLEQVPFDIIKPEFQKLKSNKAEGIPDYSDEVRPHRMKKGDLRIVLTRLPLSANNSQVLKNVLEDQYNLTDNFSIVLVIGYGNKDAENKIYRKMNSRISSEITTIRSIMDLFKEDFDQQTLKKALNLIGDSDEITKEFSKEVTRI